MARSSRRARTRAGSRCRGHERTRHAAGPIRRARARRRSIRRGTADRIRARVDRQSTRGERPARAARRSLPDRRLRPARSLRLDAGHRPCSVWRGWHGGGHDRRARRARHRARDRRRRIDGRGDDVALRAQAPGARRASPHHGAGVRRPAESGSGATKGHGPSHHEARVRRVLEAGGDPAARRAGLVARGHRLRARQLRIARPREPRGRARDGARLAGPFGPVGTFEADLSRVHPRMGERSVASVRARATRRARVTERADGDDRTAARNLPHS